MPDFVYDIAPRDLALYFALIAVGAIFIGILVVKPILRLLMGAPPDLNEAIGYATAGFSLFYGLLLGLLTVSAYQNNAAVRQAILNEATSLGALYADMSSYPEPIRSDMKAMLRDYLLFTVHRDWAAHREGEFLNGGANRANAMRQRLASFEPATKGQEIVHAQTIAAFQEFAAARQGRLTGVITEIPDVLWYAVLVGAGINLMLLVMLRMRPLLQFVLGSTTAFFLAVILFVIVALDDPLRGARGLGPGQLELLWERTMIWDEPMA
jgi:hypothetical protein